MSVKSVFVAFLINHVAKLAKFDFIGNDPAATAARSNNLFSSILELAATHQLYLTTFPLIMNPFLFMNLFKMRPIIINQFSNAG